MKHKFLEELIIYIWIPFIVGLVLYIFWELHDVWLCVVTLIAFSAVYAIVRLYLVHKKWWLLAILPVIIAGALGYFFARPPAITLCINGQTVTGSSASFSEGSVSIDPAPTSTSKYAKDTKVTLTAHPASGYDWKSWSGTDNDTANPTTVTMIESKQVTVTFMPRFSLIINNQSVIGSVVDFSEGSVSIDPAPGDDGKYANDTIVTLTASPASGYDWKSWSGTSGDTANPTTVTMSNDKHVSVTFELHFCLTVNDKPVTGTSVDFTEGSVSIDPAPGDDGNYAKGTDVTLTAIPASGYRFDHWSGDVSGSDTSVIISMDADKSVFANFVIESAP
jgi:hypothetical protein